MLIVWSIFGLIFLISCGIFVAAARRVRAHYKKYPVPDVHKHQIFGMNLRKTIFPLYGFFLIGVTLLFVFFLVRSA